MNITSQQLDEAIQGMRLSKPDCRALQRVIAVRNRPLFLGYLVRGAGLLVLLPCAYLLYSVFSLAVSSPQRQELAELVVLAGKSSVPFLLLGLLLLSGATSYLEAIREGRAVANLLMNRTAANNTPQGLRQPEDVLTKPSA